MLLPLYPAALLKHSNKHLQQRPSRREICFRGGNLLVTGSMQPAVFTLTFFHRVCPIPFIQPRHLVPPSVRFVAPQLRDNTYEITTKHKLLNVIAKQLVAPSLAAELN